MRYIIILIFVLNLSACSTTGNKNTHKSFDEQNDLSLLKKECDEKKFALSCSKYAYKIKKENSLESLKYYKIGCELFDESACYNKKRVENKSIEYNMSILKKNSDKVFRCYQNHSSDRNTLRKFMQKDTDRKVDITATISPEGNLKNLNVQGARLSNAGVMCMKNIFSAKKFMPSTEGQLLTYSVLVPRVFGKSKGWEDKVLDGMKSLD